MSSQNAAGFRTPPKPSPGDRIAVVSPSAGLPALFPRPFELGLERLRTEFGLEPVEYPGTRTMGASPQQRADDLHAAFADPSVAAVMASIGGDDQITVLPLLDRALLRAHPKPFFGYSDNTNLLAYLWNTGIVGYHGASVMTQLGRPGAMAPLTAESLRAALFTTGAYDLRPAARWTDVERPWEDPRTYLSEPELEPGGGWLWHRPEHVVEGRSWGGCLEVLSGLLLADREIPRDPSVFDGGVLFLETSEELPSDRKVFWMLQGLGKRGLLERFSALLVGRPKAWSFAHPQNAAEKAAYVRRQREAVRNALDAHAPHMMAVFDVDLGHTDPQVVMPYGGVVRVDGPARRITVTY
jgi:muramoyltetrapeptide carboxypeptidase LdcA involved in peptidoglycan recycling